MTHFLFEGGSHSLGQFCHLFGKLHLEVAPFLNVRHYVLGVLGPEFGSMQGYFDTLFKLKQNGIHLLTTQLITSTTNPVRGCCHRLVCKISSRNSVLGIRRKIFA
jgi:hypothetical protein